MRKFGKILGVMMLAGALSGCAGGLSLPFLGGKPAAEPVDEVKTQAPAIAAPKPAEAAQTAEALDTTTAAQRSAAAAVPPTIRPERELGRIVAALGDPTDPGFWAKTALVKDAQEGRLVYPETGASVLVELRPLAGAAGSQVSLAALRVLGTPLTALPELIVYAR